MHAKDLSQAGQAQHPSASASTGDATVSVIVPMRDAGPYIAEALASLLVDAPAGLEVIVIDDGSRDDSAERVRAVSDPRVRMLAGPCRGIAAAVNAGLTAARGRYLARCDADDRFTPGRLARQVRWLEDRPEFGAVCGRFATLDPRGRHIADMDTGHTSCEITEELRAGQTRTHFGTWLARTALVRQVGGLRPWFVTAEDLDLQLRLAGTCRVMYLPELAYAYRLHDASITHTQGDRRRVFFEQAARRFAAQRADDGLDELDRGCPPAVPDDLTAPVGRCSQQMQDTLTGRAWREHQAGHKRQAIGSGLRALLRRPGNPAAWRSLAALILKPVGRGTPPKGTETLMDVTDRKGV